MQHGSKTKAGARKPNSPDLAASALDARLRAGWLSFARTEQAIARYLLANTQDIPFETGATIAGGAGVSEASVTRFVRRLGYADLKDMKRGLRRQTRSSDSSLDSAELRFRTGGEARTSGSEPGDGAARARHRLQSCPRRCLERYRPPPDRQRPCELRRLSGRQGPRTRFRDAAALGAPRRQFRRGARRNLFRDPDRPSQALLRVARRHRGIRLDDLPTVRPDQAPQDPADRRHRPLQPLGHGIHRISRSKSRRASISIGIRCRRSARFSIC